jgi:hypothetical protein
MRIIQHSNPTLDTVNISLNSEIDFDKTSTLDFLTLNWKIKPIGPYLKFPGIKTWTNAIIEFDDLKMDIDDTSTWIVFDELVFPGETYRNVIPIRKVENNIWECKIGFVEQKVP